MRNREACDHDNPQEDSPSATKQYRPRHCAGLFYALRTRKHQSLSLQKSKPEIIRKWCVLGDGLICATGLFLYRSTNLCNIQ
nr:MAG TPA: hypothetical protein [Caudoviricetes sp.]